ncbi:MAG: TIGR03749 family integrating conjugative element protein [Methyloglobulus sp.]|nr:TIGR03749 family integrating conjugative element protein [Methyloglobulus sp.]
MTTSALIPCHDRKRLQQASTLLLLLAAVLGSRPAPGQPVKPPRAANLPAELSAAVPELERKVWDKRPIQIALPVNRERLVTFTVPVQVELPPDLDASLLRTQIVADTNSGTIYWTALKPFKVHRVQVQDMVSHNVYLVDIAASTAVSDTTRIEVSVPGGQTEASSQPVTAANSPVVDQVNVDPVALTRLAAQHLYAPARLLQLPDGVYPSPVRQQTTTQLYQGGALEATPVMAWRASGLTVTAVKLVNVTGHDLILDPRNLRGHWQTATFQHNVLLPQGSPRDTTAVYLISSGSFQETLGGY